MKGIIVTKAQMHNVNSYTKVVTIKVLTIKVFTIKVVTIKLNNDYKQAPTSATTLSKTRR